MNSMNESVKTAVCVLFYVDNFNHVSPLLQCRWFFSKLNKTVTCGAASTPALAPPDCKWLISSIVDPSNNSVNIRDSKNRKKKYVKFLMHPTTSVIFTYSSYRIVICLDISRSIYYVRSDGGVAADEMITSLFTMLTQIHRSLQSQLHIASVFVTVIAHHSEINFTYSLWQCEMKMTSDLEALLRSLGNCSQTIEDLTFQRVTNPDLFVEGQPSFASSVEGMSMASVVEDLLYHVNLLPPSACPIAVLITPGIMDVHVSSVTKALAVGNVALHVLVVTLSADEYPLGCVPEVDSLRVVAEATGGSLEVMSSSIAANLESFGQIFIRPFYAWREKETFRNGDIVSRVKESRLQGYQLEGATLEHVLAARLIEGFKMTNVSIESFSLSKNSTSSMNFATIRLEKRYSKVSTLVYYVSYRIDIPDSPMMVPREYKDKRAQAQFDGQSKMKYVYTRGTLSIDIVWISPDRVDLSAGKGIVADSRIMSENDKSMTSLLGLHGMPGYVASALSHIQSGKGSKVNVTSSYKYAAVQQQLAANADLIEDICKLHYAESSTMYLRAFFVLAAIANNPKCRSSIFLSIRQAIPSAKFSQLGALKWLCVIPVCLNDEDTPTRTAGQLLSPPEYYEVLVIEVRQRVSVFIEVSITMMGNGSGENCIDTTIVTDAVHKALKIVEFDPFLLERDLSLIAISNSRGVRAKYLSLCHLQSLCHFVPINLSQRFLMESLVSEVCRSKIALGFQVSNCAGDDQVELCLCAVIPGCPSGIESDSLLQCKVECSEEGVLTSYYWEPGQEVRQFHTLRMATTAAATATTNDPFAMTKELVVSIGKDGAMDPDPPPPVPKLTSKNCAEMLVDLVDRLVDQDKQTYDFYGALSRIYPEVKKSGTPKSVGLLQTMTPLKISHLKWNCLKAYSYKRKINLPSFSQVFYSKQFQVGSSNTAAGAAPLQEGESNYDEDSLDGIEEYSSAVVSQIKTLLRESLVGNMQLVEFEVQPQLGDCDDVGGISAQKRLMTYCQSVPEGLLIIEIDPVDDAATMFTPVRKMSLSKHIDDMRSASQPHSIVRSYSQQHQHDLGFKSDDDEFLMSPDYTYNPSFDDRPDGMFTGRAPPMERAPSSQDDMSQLTMPTLPDEILSKTELSREAFIAVDEDPSSAKLRIDFHFISIPLNTLFGNSELTEMAKKCTVATDVSLLKDKHEVTPRYEIAESAKNRLKEMKQAILKHHRYNFSLVLYSGIRNGDIVNVDPMDLDTALSHCSCEYVEVDMTNLCSIKRVVYEGSISPSSSVSHLSSPDLFQFTMGKYLVPVANSDVYLFAPSPEIFNLPMHDKLCSIAVFVRFAIVRKPLSSDTGSEQASMAIPVANTSSGLSNLQFELYSAKDESGDAVDENITLRVECLTSSTEDVEMEIKNSCSMGGGSAEGPTAADTTSLFGRDRSISELQSAFGNPGVSMIGSALHNFYRTSVIRRLTTELESLLTFDTLHTLLLMPVVTTETIVLVQHCLRGTKSLYETTHQMDFVIPVSSFTGAFVDVLTGYFDEELQNGGVINKIGDIYYARGWTLAEPVDKRSDEAASHESKAVPASRTNSHSFIPCWILLSIVNCTVRTEKIAEENMSVITMDVGVVLRMVGEYAEEQNMILQELVAILNKCCYRVNQRALLQDLNQSRVASPLLIKSAATAPQPTVTVPRRPGRLSAQSKVKEDTLPSFVFPDEPPMMPLSSLWESYAPGCFECPKQGRIDLMLPRDVSAVLSTSALSHASVVASLETLALQFFILSNLKKCFVYQQKSGQVFYMAFAPCLDDKDRTISLVVFGITPLSSQVKSELKKTLEVKLTELIANVISLTIIPRRAVLPTTHVQFLKECGLSKREDFCYEIPAYVTDPYFFCVLAKQIFNKSEIFTTLTLQYDEKKETLSSVINPATFGYDIVEAEKEEETEHDKMLHHGIFRPNLQRKSHVTIQRTDPSVLSPIFFFRNKRKQTPRTKSYCDSSLVQWEQGDFTLLYNANPITAGSSAGGGGGVGDKDKNKAKRNAGSAASKKRSVASQGSGLALIEFEPVIAHPFHTAVESLEPDPEEHEEGMKAAAGPILPKILPTGSIESLMTDVEFLVKHVENGDRIVLNSVTRSQENSSALDGLLETEGSPAKALRESNCHNEYKYLSIRVYPTRAIKSQSVAENFRHCFNQTLVMYCMERLYAGYQHRSSAIPSRVTSRRRIFNDRRMSFDGIDDMYSNPDASYPFDKEILITGDISGGDLLRASHDITLRNDVLHDQLSCTDLLRVSISLPKSAAKILYQRIVKCANELIPKMKKHLVLPETEAIFSLPEQMENCHALYPTGIAAAWLDVMTSEEAGTCSGIIGEHFEEPREGEIYEWKGGKDGHLAMVPDMEWASAVRWIGDVFPDNPLLFPLWLRKRRFSIEVTLTPDGVYVFFYNIEKSVVDMLKKHVVDITLNALRFAQASQVLLLEKTGLRRIVNPVKHPVTDEKWKNGLTLEKLYILQRQISNLFWSQHVLARLYMFPSAEPQVPPPSSQLCVVNELADIPFFVWEEGLVISTSCMSMPLPLLQQATPSISTSTSLAALADFAHPLPSKSRSESNVMQLLLDYGPAGREIVHYISFLRHLLASIDYIYVGNLSNNNVYILLPIPRTSSLYIVQLHLASSEWLIVTRRMADCKDVITSISDHFALENEEWLVSPVSVACLEEPCLGSSHERDVPLSGQYGESQSVVDAIVSHPTVFKLNASLHYASLASLYFGCGHYASSLCTGRNMGDSVLSIMRGTADALHDEVVYLEESISMNDLIGEDKLVYSLHCPSAQDILSRFAFGFLSDRAVYLHGESDLASCVVCFRFAATSRALPEARAYSRMCSRSGIGSGARWADLPLPRDHVTRSQRKTHTLFAEATLGFCVLRKTPGDGQTLTLTTLLFPGEKVVGSEKDLLANTELESRVAEELGKIRYLAQGSLQHVCEAVEKDILAACDSAVAGNYLDAGWSMLFNEISRQQDGHFMAAIFRFSQHISLHCLDFLLPTLDILVSPKHARTFKKVCQQALGSRYFFFASTANEEAIAHYVILGEDNGSAHERHCVHIAASMILGSSIQLLEADSSVVSSEDYVNRQQELIESIVDIVLYATSLIYEDDKLSFGSFHS